MNFLGYENEKIYLQFCAASIRRLSDDVKVVEIFQRFNEKLIEFPNIFYINLEKEMY